MTFLWITLAAVYAIMAIGMMLATAWLYDPYASMCYWKRWTSGILAGLFWPVVLLYLAVLIAWPFGNFK